MDRKNLKGQIHNAIYQNVLGKGWASPIDVLMGIGVLSKKNYENWRLGRVPFLEKVCQANLRQLSEIMREIRAYADKNTLKPSYTCYYQWGKNNKTKLQFSKTGDEKIEYYYATHYVDTKRIEELKQPTPSNEKSE